MPELPEVETMRRGLFPIIGHRIKRVVFPPIPYRPIAVLPERSQLVLRAQSREIVAIDRIAKRVLVRLDSEDTIVIQPKMAGIVLLTDPPSDCHTRVIFYLQGPSENDRFLYWDRRGLGTVSILDRRECERLLGPDCVGPDASEVDFGTFLSRLKASKKEVKVALLDQRLVSGIGNLYAAEILYAARVHPQARCQEIATVRWRKIHAATIRILKEAIEKEGSTLSDGTYRNAINGEGSYQNEHQVYDRAGLPCPRSAGHRIARIVQAQRSTFFCPQCQKS